jgi:hypothetical protein
MTDCIISYPSSGPYSMGKVQSRTKLNPKLSSYKKAHYAHCLPGVNCMHNIINRFFSQAIALRQNSHGIINHLIEQDSGCKDQCNIDIGCHLD